jgi:hypothetical protein
MAKVVFFGRCGGSEDNLREKINVQQDRYRLQVHVETVPM